MPPGSFPDFFVAVVSGLVEDPAGDAGPTLLNLLQGRPAPWLLPHSGFDDSAVTEIAVLPVGPLEPLPELPVPHGPTGLFTTARAPGLDAIAAYRPWHFFYDDWGVYIFEREFFGFVRDFATLVGLPPSRVAPLAF